MRVPPASRRSSNQQTLKPTISTVNLSPRETSCSGIETHVDVQSLSTQQYEISETLLLAWKTEPPYSRSDMSLARHMALRRTDPVQANSGC